MAALIAVVPGAAEHMVAHIVAGHMVALVVAVRSLAEPGQAAHMVVGMVDQADDTAGLAVGIAVVNKLAVTS